MKIVHLFGSLGIGGVQIYALHLSKFDYENGIKRAIITLFSNKGSLRDKFLDNGVEIGFCPVLPPDRGWRPYFFWKKLRNIGSLIFPFKLFFKLKSISPDIIIIDEPLKLLSQLWVAKFLNIPIVWVIHAERTLLKRKNIFKWSYKLFFKSKLKIVSDSKYVLNKNIGYLKNDKSIDFNNIPIVHATTDLSKFLSLNIQHDMKIGFEQRPFIQLGTIGRLNWAKGFDHLIAALSRLKQQMPNFHLKIVGEGPYRKYLENMIENNQLSSNIQLVGELQYNEISNFLKKLNIYIQPSVSEGSPITIKEAMASGLPVLASDAGGIPEIIEHNITGFIFKKGSIDDLEKELLKIINLGYERRQNIGMLARKKAKELFDIKKNSKDLLKIYNTILDKD